jgi:Carboxypeptidase regulatory-like domain
MIAGCRNAPATNVARASAAAPVAAQTVLTGNVRGPERIAAVEGRVVEVVNVDTNERQRSTTNSAGTFIFKVKPGKYRVELTLREGESLVRAPGVKEVSRTDVDSHVDFIVGARRISRPRSPAHRTDDRLGNPIG